MRSEGLIGMIPSHFYELATSRFQNPGKASSHDRLCAEARKKASHQWSDWESACRLPRRRMESTSSRSASTSTVVCSQTGTAVASRVLPCGVSFSRRPRRSEGFVTTLTRPRRTSGLSAAVKVVRSMASSDATDAMSGGSGRFSDISRENWPFVRPNGRNASSKRRARARAARCTWRQRHRSRTRVVVSK